MNKNAVYITVFGVLCVLSGALIGAGIARSTAYPFRPPRHEFAEKAERYMRFGPRMHRFSRMHRGGYFDALINQLDLNSEQKSKVGEIVAKTREEIRVIGENVRASIDGIRDKSKQEIMAVLTPEQQKRFQSLLDDARGPRGSRDEHPMSPPPEEDSGNPHPPRE